MCVSVCPMVFVYPSDNLNLIFPGAQYKFFLCDRVVYQCSVKKNIISVFVSL